VSIILKYQAFSEEPYPNTAATGPYPAGRPEGTGRAAPRFVTWPHIRGACLYDGDRIIAVGRLNDIEEAAEHLNRNYLQDVDEVLRSRGLSG
jgi:hypothetical protein